MPELNFNILKNSANLKAYYRFESGAETTDSSGNSHTLTAIATPTFSAGKFGQGVNYASASSQAHSAVQHADFQPTAILSAGMWFKSSTAAIQGMFQSYTEASSKVSGWDIHLLADGSFECLLGNNTGITLNTHYTKVTSGTGYADGNWHHVVLIWNKPTAQLYIDGKYIASSGSFNNDLAYSASTVVRVGCRNVDGSTNLQFFNGSLDDVFLLNGTALSADQIKELYEGRTVGEGWSQANLVAGYHLNNSSTDFSGNNNHGTDTAITYSLANGKFNQGAGFNGSSSKIALPSGMARLYNTVTIAGWINIGALLGAGGVYQITNEWGASTRNYLIYIDENEKINFIVGNGTSSQDATLTTTTTLSVGSWYYLSCVINGTTHDLYLNGNKEATQVGSYQGGSTAAARWIGVDSAGTAQFFNGKMDELQFFNVSKDANWVRKQYAWSLGKFL